MSLRGRHRAVGVVLSGSDGDGAAGLQAIKHRGGIAVVQRPNDCQYPQMPESAIEAAKPHFVVPAEEIGSLLQKLVADGSCVEQLGRQHK